MNIRFSFLGIALILSAGIARAQTPSFELQASSGAEIGAPTVLSGSATYPEKYALIDDLSGQTTGSFSISKVEFGPAQTHDGWKTQTVAITVVPFDLGALTFPPISWALHAADGASALKSPPVKLNVSGPDAKENQDIRDIRGPVGPKWWPLLLALFVVLAIAGYLYEKFGKSAKEVEDETPQEPVDPRKPHEIALEDLEGLDYGKMTPKEYYDRISDIVRLYLERRYEIPALNLTTTDLMRQMREAEIERKIIADAKELFDQCDLAKFAKFQPEADAAARDRGQAASVVRATIPPETNANADSKTADRMLQ